MEVVATAARRRRAKTRIVIAVAGAIASLSIIPSPRALADDASTISSRVTSQLLSSSPSDSTTQGYISSLQANGSWSDVNYASTAATNWAPLTHLQRMEAMAQSYDNPKSSLYQNATLAADLSSAMNFWVSANPQSSNWFDNDIAGPQALGAAMVLAKPAFSAGQISSGQTILGRAKATIPQFTGQNVVDLSIPGVYSAIVSGSTSDMNSAFGSMNGTVFVSNFGTDGIQADSTYHIHDIQLYMGGYGTSYINDMLNWASISAGTSYALTDSQEHTIVNYLLDGTQWFIRGQTLDLAANGRQVTFPSYVGAGDGYVGAIQNALALGNYRTSELQAFLARQKAIVQSGQASSTQNTLTGNRAFYDSDAMVQQRPGYYASVKVTSTRTSDPESGNAQGLKNLYLGDGVNQIMVTGNEYLGIQPVWNWYRLPGTTVEQDGRSLKPASDWGVVHGTTAYAGGVSDGTYGAEAFNYARYDVAAKKSWFFFDNEEVALGAAINSSSTSFEVDTTLNQCLLTSAVSYETTGAASQTFSTGTITPANLKWVNQGGVGYFFINPASNATISAISQSGAWSSLNTAASSATVASNVFTLYINHGTAVANGSYSYIAVPGLTADQMDNYLATNPIQVLSNTATMQAVRQATLNITQAAFYSAGSFSITSGQTVASSAPSAVMLQSHPNSLKLSASSPQASTGALNISLSGINLSGGSTWFDQMGTATAGFNLPGGNIAGSTVGVTLSSDGQATPTVSLTSNDQITNSSYSVSVPVALANNTTFQEDKFSTIGFAATVSGTAGITQNGPGVLVLSGSNTFTGGVTVNGGAVRANNPKSTGAGAGAATINPGGDFIVGTALASPVTLAGGAMNFSGTPSLSGTLTAAPGTTSTIQTSDPASPATSVNVTFTGILQGSGTIVLANATGVTSPDGTNALRINASNASNFSGALVLPNNIKGELFGTTSGNTTPVGSASIILAAGDAAYGNSLNTLTATGGYSELNLRNNTSGNQVYGNNVQVTGTGLVIINPLGSAPSGSSVSMGNLQIGNGQTLGVYLSSTFAAHPLLFQSVTLTGGTASFAPKPNGFGSASSTGSDLYLANIQESVPGSGIAMTGLRTLFLDGDNTYTGPTTANSGTLIFAPDPSTGHSTSSISTIKGAAPVIVNAGANVTSDGIQLTSLTVNGVLALHPPYTNANTSTLSALTIGGSTGSWTGGLDLAGNDLIVEDAINHTSTLATLRNQVTFGWTHRAGIYSSIPPSAEVLAVLDNSVVGFPTFGGMPVDSGSILIGPELIGDANLDGQVDDADLAIVQNHLGQSSLAWTDGNFDGNPTIDATDVQIVKNMIGTVIPEPGSATLMCVAGSTLVLRDRRIGATRQARR